MALFSRLRDFSGDDWRNFLITGAAVIVGMLILYLWHRRKVGNKDED